MSEKTLKTVNKFAGLANRIVYYLLKFKVRLLFTSLRMINMIIFKLDFISSDQ